MDLFDLSGKVAVVTGGTRGIGLMMARGLLQAGCATVHIASRKAEAVAEAVAELSQYGHVTGIPADLSQEAGCVRLAEEVGATDDRVHILVDGRIVDSGGMELVERLERDGYEAWRGP